MTVPLLFSAVAVSAPLPVPTTTAEVPATSTDLRLPSSYNSPLLVPDPEEPRFVALAYRQDAPDFGCGMQVSGDSGRSWVPAQPVPKLPEGAERCYAPEVVFDKKGTLYYLFIGLVGAGNNPVGVYLATSTDRGQTFSEPRLLLGPSNYQVRMAIDPTIGDRGRIHIVWLHAASDAPIGGLPPEPNPLFAAHSDDGGRTFSAPVQISDPERPRVVAPALVVGPGRSVHVAYYDLQDDVRDYQGLEGPPWEGRWSVVVTSSFDGGKRFGRGVLVDDQLVPPGRVMLIYTMPPPSLAVDESHRLFVAWWDSRQGDPDVFLARSVTRGRTWEAPRRLNDDPSGNGKEQYLVRLAVAPTGRLDAVFLDRRNDPENVRNDVYYTYSGDGGRTFAANVKVTSESSDSRIGQRYLVPSSRGLIEVGGRLGLLARSSSAVLAWPDMRNSAAGTPQQDVFTAEVRFPGVADEGNGESGPGWVIGGVIAVVASVVTLVVAIRRRSGSRTPHVA
jgi:hypothetical protein